jgi:hypothetical protein
MSMVEVLSVDLAFDSRFLGWSSAFCFCLSARRVSDGTSKPQGVVYRWSIITASPSR